MENNTIAIVFIFQTENCILVVCIDNVKCGRAVAEYDIMLPRSALRLGGNQWLRARVDKDQTEDVKVGESLIPESVAAKVTDPEVKVTVTSLREGEVAYLMESASNGHHKGRKNSQSEAGEADGGEEAPWDHILVEKIT